MELETDTFVGTYTSLYKEFVLSKTTEDLVAVMYKMNGGYLNPLAVFDPLSGETFPFNEMKPRIETMFRRILKVNAREQIVCLFLNMNTNSIHQKRKDSPRIKKPLTASRRRALINKGVLNPEVYFDSRGRVR